MFRTVPLSITSSFSLHTQQWYMSYRLQLASSIRAELVPPWYCSQTVSKPVWNMPLLCVQWKTLDDGQRNSPKHVEFYFKVKFGKLVHLAGFIIRIYHDARSPERQIVSNHSNAHTATQCTTCFMHTVSIVTWSRLTPCVQAAALTSLLWVCGS